MLIKLNDFVGIISHQKLKTVDAFRTVKVQSKYLNLNSFLCGAGFLYPN